MLEGAGSRNDTTAAAIAALGEDECNVILHDAVRPLVSQTPQSFRLSVLRAAYAKAGEDPDFTATDDCTVVLRYLPDVAIGVVVGHEKNMKVTEPIDVYIADKLFQLTSADQPEALTDAEYRSRLEGRTVVVFGGSYGIGGDIAELARSHGAIVKVFSRSTTNTHVERREDLVLAARQVIEETGAIDFVVNTAGVLPRGELAEASEEQVLQATDVNYLAPIYIEQEFYPHLAASKGSLLLFTSSSYTRGRSGYALYSSAKAAVVNLTQALADEWAPSGRSALTGRAPLRPDRSHHRHPPRPTRPGVSPARPGQGRLPWGPVSSLSLSRSGLSSSTESPPVADFTLVVAAPAAPVTLSLTIGAFSLASSVACWAFSCTRGSSFTLVAAPMIWS